MEYMTQDELTRVMVVAKEQNELHWQAMLTAFYFGLRVSEVIQIMGEDVQDGQLRVKRLKRSETTLQPLPATDGTPAFDLRLGALAQAAGPRGRVFP
jgi:integrase